MSRNGTPQHHDQNASQMSMMQSDEKRMGSRNTVGNGLNPHEMTNGSVMPSTAAFRKDSSRDLAATAEL